jgi:hypothetical protein
VTAGKLIAPLVGIGLALGHWLALPLLLDRCGRDALEVRAEAPPAAVPLSVSAELPAGIYDRTEVLIDGRPGDLATARVGPGLHRIDWKVAYRGGFERRVGLTQLVGPFQDRTNPPCSVRLLVGQSFLDDGAAGPGTIAHLAKAIVTEQLTGMEQWPIGRFREVDTLRLSWSDAALGSLVVDVVVRFSDGEVPLQLIIVPRLGDGGVELKAFARARVDLDSRIYQWVADLFDADVIAGATAEDEVGYALRDAFRPPPPVPLPGGRQLVFGYCPHQQIQIVAGQFAAVPLQMTIEDGHGTILPVSFGPVDNPPPVVTDAPISLELNLDAINAILYYLWHTDFLDQELDAAGVDERFNTDSAVQDLLSIRIADIDLSLPPTASLASSGDRALRLGAEATLTITDGDTVTPARVYSSIGFDVVGGDSRELVARLTLDDLALSCEPQPNLLRPCYADLVSELAGRSDDLHGELTRLFTAKFNQIVLGQRVGTDETLADFHIERAEVHVTRVDPTALIRVDLFGGLE